MQPATQTSSNEVDPALVRACYEFVRHVHHPRRILANPIAARLLAHATTSIDLEEEERLAEILGAALRAALANLPLRRRAIVQRCDLEGERFASVARELSICERHLFRERRAAIVELATALTSRSPALALPSSTTSGLATELAFATRLEHNGHWQAAADALERLQRQVSDVEVQCRIAIRLAALYREACRPSMAEHHAAIAKSLAKLAGSECLAARAEIAAARIFVQAGRPRDTRRLLDCTSRLLRTWASGERTPEIQEALIDSLELSSELAHARGDLDSARAAALEILSILTHCGGVDPLLEIIARSSAALALMYFQHDAARYERELWNCYAAAVEQGFARQAIVVATNLGGYFRLQQRAAQALELLEPLLDRARIVAVGESRGGFFCELVSACIESGALAKAADFLPDLRECSATNPALHPAADLAEAKMHLAYGDFAQSLAFAEAAESGYVGLGGDRLVGAALRLQAEALAGLGRTEQATRVAAMAIERLRKGSHPKRLAAAYQTLASITGERRHLLTARKLETTS